MILNSLSSVHVLNISKHVDFMLCVCCLPLCLIIIYTYISMGFHSIYTGFQSPMLIIRIHQVIKYYQNNNDIVTLTTDDHTARTAIGLGYVMLGYYISFKVEIDENIILLLFYSNTSN